MREIEINFDLFRRPVFLFTAVLMFLIPYLGIDFQHCYAQANQYTANLTFNKFMFGIIANKFIYALLGLGILVQLMRLLNTRLGLKKMMLSPAGVLRWQAGLLAIAVTSALCYFLLSIPLSNLISTVDFGPMDEGDNSLSAALLTQFSFLTILGLFLGNANVINSAFAQRNKNQNEETVIKAFNGIGEVHLRPEEVIHCSKSGRQYWVHTLDKTYRSYSNLTEMEALLEGHNFFRANRASIVNMSFIEELSFWEFDKYILRLNNPAKTEIVISRQRWRALKSMLKITHKPTA